MTTRDTSWPEGTPCWVVLSVDDFGKAQAFYSQLFGWDIPDGSPDFGGYSGATKDGRAVAGISPRMDPGEPTGWTTYLAVDDLDATIAKVRDSGGQVVVEPMDIADLGKMAVAIDQGGAVVGFWQAGTHTGFELANEPGSVIWNENLSRAWQGSKAFYTSVSGWEYDDMSGEGFEYAAFKAAGSPNGAGGIGQMGADVPQEVPPNWNVYFNVADADAAIEVVKRLGGAVVKEAWDTTFGRMASVTDDQGAPFMLIAS